MVQKNEVHPGCALHAFHTCAHVHTQASSRLLVPALTLHLFSSDFCRSLSLQFRAGTTEERLDTLVAWFRSNPGSGKAVKKLFWDLDIDGSGDIDRGEFLVGMRALPNFPKLQITQGEAEARKT